MSDDKSTIESFQVVAVGLDHIARSIDELLKNIRRDEAEITKLNSIIDELRDENEWLKQEAKGGEA
jgi:prefoldin subunit 5